VGVHRHLRFPSFEDGLRYGIPEERDSRGLANGEDNASVDMIGRCKVLMTPLLVQKGGLVRNCVLRLARDAFGVPYSKVVNT